MQSDSFQALQALKPDYVSGTKSRLTALNGAIDIVAGLVDNPEMKRIWRKFSITQYQEAEGIAEFSEHLQTLREKLADCLQDDNIDLAHAEAVLSEFRDTIAAGRHFIGILQASLVKAGPFVVDLDLQKQNLTMLDEILKSASISPIKLDESYIEHDLWSVSHYLARHTGVEGVHYGRAFQEFVDDFGGEVMEFVQKNPALTAISVVGLYMMLNNNGGGNQAIDILPEYAASTSIDPVTLMPVPVTPPDDLAIRTCHPHVPPQISAVVPEDLLKAYKLIHCLSSNEVLVQLQDAYAIAKGPLNTILQAPDQATDALSALRPADAPPFAFGNSFHDSIKFFGDFYFVANGYQNLAHAPWFGIAAAMGWKLGAVQALKKTSALICPLVDAVAALARTNPMILPVVIAAAAYGYVQPGEGMAQQGLSGAIAGGVMGGFAGWGLQGATDLLRKIPELKAFQENGIAQSITPSQASVTKAKTLIAQGCPEGLAHMVEDLLQKTFEAPVRPQPLTLQQDQKVWLNIGGEQVKTTITNESFLPLLTALEELNFTLETAPDKIGIDDHDEKYLNALKKAAARGIQALRDSASWDIYGIAERLHLTHSLRGSLELLIGAELKHLGETSIYGAFAGKDLSRRQKKQLELQAARTKREYGFHHASGVDGKSLVDLCQSMADNFPDITVRPLKMPLNALYKLGSAAKILLKMGLRASWYATLQGLSLSAQQINKLEPKTKGNIIGAGLTVAAAAAGADFSNAIPDQHGSLAHTARHVSSAAGHAAGAATATGLFAVYNFAEDHLVIHVGLGYVFIITASGVKLLAARPAQKIARTLLTPAIDAAEDYLRLPVRAPGRWGGQGVRFLKNYWDDVVHYDERYTKPAAKDKEHSCCGHDHHHDHDHNHHEPR